ncbi:MAG: HU family DNA-binding protein [Deltaproteobacteria bacterium]|nr:HU family DNA-binding protein [Deltaproteobacteria bacterium]
MNKTDLVSKVAEVVATKKEAQAAVDTVLSAITDSLAAGDTVTLVGFGTFKTVKRGARTGRNPQTGKTLEIAARTAAKFTPGKALKDAVN